MTDSVYPPSLPVPSGWVVQGPDRRASSSLPGNTALRARWRDRIFNVDAQWNFNADEMEDWRAWYEDVLLDGMRWFEMTAPGEGGYVARVFRHRTRSVRREALGNGIFRVSASLEQRGAAVAPQYTPPPQIAFTSGQGTDTAPTIPTTAAGDYLIAFIHVVNDPDPPAFTVGAWGTLIANQEDSSDSTRLWVYGRVATGTAADEANLAYLPSAGAANQTTWAVARLRGGNDAAFPGALSGGGSDYAFGSLNANPVDKSIVGDFVTLAVAYSFAPDFGAVLDGDPAGYTLGAVEQFPRFTTSLYIAHLRVAYKQCLGVSTEDPGAFSDGNGAYFSGGYRTFTLGIFYTPA